MIKIDYNKKELNWIINNEMSSINISLKHINYKFDD